jgi:hypothetical protein
VTLRGISNSGIIRNVGTPDFSTGVLGRLTTNTWNGSPQRKLTANTQSGKLGADQKHLAFAATSGIGIGADTASQTTTTVTRTVALPGQTITKTVPVRGPTKTVIETVPAVPPTAGSAIGKWSGTGNEVTPTFSAPCQRGLHRVLELLRKR